MSEYGPEFDEYAERVRREVAPIIKDSGVFVSITPSSPEKVDIKFAVELGLAIMYDKPILAVVPLGTKLPKKLASVVDSFVILDEADDDFQTRLTDAIQELATVPRKKAR